MIPATRSGANPPSRAKAHPFTEPWTGQLLPRSIHRVSCSNLRMSAESIDFCYSETSADLQKKL